MPTATMKPASVQYHPLDTPAQMGQAIAWCLEFGYRGAVQAYIPQGKTVEQAVWALELNGPGNADPVQTTFGHVLVWDEPFLRVFARDEFETKFDVDLDD